MPRVLAAMTCGVVGASLFQFFGNATRGYVDTASMFWWWVSQWLDPRAESQHGWIVLAASGGMLWWRLKPAESSELRVEGGEPAESPELRAESKSSAGFPPTSGKDRWRNRLQAGSYMPAFAAMLVGLALHAVGFAAQQTRLSIVAFLVFTWGVLRLGGGRRWGRAAVFPLGFLVFAIPVNVLDSAGFWLQMGVVKATAALAGAASIDVLRNGTQLASPDGRYHYDVVAACSGVRSLVALTALAVLAGYLSFSAWRRRAIILGLCFPLVYLGNVARLASIVFAAQVGGQKWGDVAHEIMGFGVFAIVLGGLLGAVVLIQRWWPEPLHLPREAEKNVGSGERVAVPVEPAVSSGLASNRTGAPSIGRSRTSRLGKAGSTWIATSIVLLAIGEMVFLRHLADSPARGGAGVVLAADGVNPIELPAFLGTEWVGRRTEVTAIEREILPADTGYSRKLYVPVAEPTKHVLLSIVLSGRDRTSIHRPELCLVGQGWTIAGRIEHAFKGAGPGAPAFPATVLRVKRELTTPRGKVIVPQLVAYWFVSADRIVATHWQRVGLDTWNRVAHARADRWAYVLMQTDASDGEAAALAQMQAVLDGTLPVFQPVWGESPNAKRANAK